MNLVTLSACCADHYPQTNETYIGGNAFNQALTWHAISGEETIHLICRIGDDKNGQHIKSAMERRGFDLSHVSMVEGITARNRLRVDGEGERFEIEGSWISGVSESFTPTEEDWRLIYQADLISTCANNHNILELQKRKKETQCLSIDFMDKENHIDMAPLLVGSDIAFISATPTDKSFYKEMAEQSGKLVVLTMGRHGSIAFYQGEEFFQDAIKVRKVIDTTGCGDTFQAAFAYYYLKSGKNIREALEQGANWASLATFHHCDALVNSIDDDPRIVFLLLRNGAEEKCNIDDAAKLHRNGHHQCAMGIFRL